MVLDAGNPGAYFSWSTGETSQQITVDSVGEYSLMVTAGFGCSSFDTTSVSMNVNPVVDLGPDGSFCEGDSVLLDAANAGNSFQWSTGDSTQTIVVNTSGNYFVYVTDSNGCTGFDVANWAGLLGPAGIDPKIVAKLHDEIVLILGTPDMQARIKTLGFDMIVSTPEQFGTQLTKDVERWSDVVKRSNMQQN